MKVTDEWLYEKMPIVDAAMDTATGSVHAKRLRFFR